MLVNIKITGIKEGHDIDTVIEQVALHYKRDSDSFRAGLRAAIEAPELAKPLMQNLDPDEAQRTCEILAGFGLLCEKDEGLSLALEPVEEIHRCPACQHEQPAAEDGNDICERCGVVAAKYNDSLRKKILDEEKQKQRLKQRRAAIDAEKEQAQHQEQAIREEIQAQLHSQPKTSKRKPMIALGLLVCISAITAMTQLDAIRTHFGKQTAATAQHTDTGHAPKVNLAGLQAMAQHAAAQATENSGNLPDMDLQHLKTIENLVAPQGTEKTAETPAAGEAAETRRYAHAFEEAKVISDPKRRAVAIRQITQHAMQGDHSPQTLELFERELRGFGSQETQPLGMRIIDAWLKKNDPEHALKTASDFRDPYQKAEALRKVALWSLAHSRTADLDTIVQTLVATIPDIRAPHEKAKALSTIAHIHYARQQDKQAEAYLQKAFDQSDLALQIDHKIDALNRIGVDQLAVGDGNLGLQIFDNLVTLASGLSKYNPAKSRSFAIIAKGLAQSGNFIDAKKNVSRIRDDKLRDQTLIEIADLAIAAGKPAMAQVFSNMRQEAVQVGQR